MYVLILMLALAPKFEPNYTRTVYLTERDCLFALHKAIDLEAPDGVLLIGKCVPKERA
jgi:hypothetical protein